MVRTLSQLLPVPLFVLGFPAVGDSYVLTQPISEGLNATPGSKYVTPGSNYQPIEGTLTLDHFHGDSPGCYDRQTQNGLAVVDSHIHMRPPNGSPIPLNRLIKMLQRSGILFALALGNGYGPPIDNNCTNYLKCPGTNVIPSLKTDFFNVQSFLDNRGALDETSIGPQLTLSMTFADLSKPAWIVPGMQLLQKEYNGMFKWMGEINLVEQSLWSMDSGRPVPVEDIEKFVPFMKLLQESNMPILLHCDLGNDAQPTQFLPLMDKILALYPNNKIVWANLAGLSKELTNVITKDDDSFAPKHVLLIIERLRRHPNLFIDLASDILYDYIYTDPIKLSYYVDLLNSYPDRFIPGTGFAANVEKNKSDYLDELNKTSIIYQHISDKAFRSIALGQNYFALANLSFVAPDVCLNNELEYMVP